MASNQKMQENKPTLKFNFTWEYMWPVLILGIFCSDGQNQRALIISWFDGLNACVRCAFENVLPFKVAKTKMDRLTNVSFVLENCFGSMLTNVYCIMYKVFSNKPDHSYKELFYAERY